MAAPPPYYPPQRSKTNAIVWWIVGGAVVCCIGPMLLLGGVGLWGFGKVKGFAGCMFVYNDVQKGILDYAQDHDGKLPKAESWQDDVRSYYKKNMTPKDQLGPFDEPAPEGDWGCKDTEGNMTGMAFNSTLSGKKLASVGDQVSTIVVFEVEHPGKNLHEVYKPRPYETSPMIFNKHRGWMEMPLSGAPVIYDKNGNKVPIKTRVRTNTGPGIHFNVNTGSDNK